MKLRRYHVTGRHITRRWAANDEMNQAITINIMGDRAWFTFDREPLKILSFPSVAYAEGRILKFDLDGRIDWQDEFETEDEA